MKLNISKAPVLRRPTLLEEFTEPIKDMLKNAKRSYIEYTATRKLNKQLVVWHRTEARVGHDTLLESSHHTVTGYVD